MLYVEEFVWSFISNFLPIKTSQVKGVHIGIRKKKSVFIRNIFIWLYVWYRIFIGYCCRWWNIYQLKDLLNYKTFQYHKDLCSSTFICYLLYLNINRKAVPLMKFHLGNCHLMFCAHKVIKCRGTATVESLNWNKY